MGLVPKPVSSRDKLSLWLYETPCSLHSAELHHPTKLPCTSICSELTERQFSSYLPYPGTLQVKRKVLQAFLTGLLTYVNLVPCEATAHGSHACSAWPFVRTKLSQMLHPGGVDTRQTQHGEIRKQRTKGVERQGYILKLSIRRRTKIGHVHGSALEKEFNFLCIE